MKKPRLSVLLIALALFFSTVLAVGAVPPQPTTLYGKVLVGGSDVLDGTSVTAWMGSTEPIATVAPLSFPGTGVSIAFSDGCTGDVTALRQAGETQVMSPDGYTSVYAMDVLGPSDWEPPDDPVTEDEAITLKIGDTVAAVGTWNMGTVSSLPLTVDSLAGGLPYTPVNVTLLGQVWDISTTCTGFIATVTFTYDDSLLGGVDEADIAGMARYDPGYNRWEYLAGAVDTGANTVTVSDVTAFSQWRLLASTPPLAIADLTASRSGGNLVLDWSDVTLDIRGQDPGAVTYNIYRAANDPYFTPGGTPYDTAPDSTYTDLGAIGDPNTNYYYVVTTVGAAGTESALSDRIGEFDFALVAGSSPGDRKYNFVTLVLDVQSIIDADSLADYVGEGTVYQVMRYDAADQGFTFPDNVWLPQFGIGTNFSVQVGQVYGLQLEPGALANLCFVGQVPARQSVTFPLVPGAGAGDRKYNFISIPLDRPVLTTADELADDIGEGTVYQVMRYDGEDQGFTFPENVWLPQFGIGTNFSLQVGHPYVVQLEQSAPATWPDY